MVYFSFYLKYLLILAYGALQVNASVLLRPDLPEPTPTTKSLSKRVEANVPVLWSSIPPDKLVKAGLWDDYKLIPTEDRLISTTEYYGCTILIIHDGKNLMLGHFKEAQGASEENDQTLDSAVRTQNYIIKRLEYEYEAMVDANPNTRAWIIATSSLGAGYRALVTHLTDDYGIPRPNIQFKGYTRGGEDPDGSFPGSPRGKAVIQWIHKPDGTGATMNIFAGSNTAIFSQDYDCSGNPVGGIHKRDGQPCKPPEPKVPPNSLPANSPPASSPPTTSPPATSPPSPTPSCTYRDPEPPEQPGAACECDGTSGLPLITLEKETLPTESSCAWTTLPQASTVKDPMGPPETDMKACQVCTRLTYNEDSCSPIPNCVKQLAQATVQAGSSPVHVGTLTSSALSTSISSALDKLCPSVTKNSDTACSTDSVTIDHIDYKNAEEELMNTGTLEVKVESSSYNESTIRKAMIDAAALTAMQSAVGGNCYDDKVGVGAPDKFKRMYNGFATAYNALVPRSASVLPLEPVPETIHWCNAAAFAGVQYFGEYARLAPTLSATDYLDARWEFHAGGNDKFDCAFLGELIDAMVILAPEFALADLGLGEAVMVSCETVQDFTGSDKRDVPALPPSPRWKIDF